MKNPLLLSILSLGLACSSQAAPLTSFSDDFDRADGAIGSNYTLGKGDPYLIDGNELLNTNVGDDESITYLNLGTLPTAADYTAGKSFSASIDLFIGDQTDVTVFGLALNYQDGSNFSGVVVRSAGVRQVNYVGRSGGGQQSVNGTSASDLILNNQPAWFTLEVESSAAGSYDYVFSLRSNSAMNVSGSFTSAGDGYTSFDGGEIGFYVDKAAVKDGYLFDNFSVTVVPEPTTTASAILGSLGLFVFCRRHRATKLSVS